MTPDHAKLVVDAGKFFFGTLIGAFVSKQVVGHADLISFFGHVAAFQGEDSGKKYTVHTHEVVLRNAGRQPAHNVRLTHAELPQFNIVPSIPFSVETLPDGKKDILIPLLVSNQQIVISYLYFPPLTYAGVNAGIRCDEGFAKAVEIELNKKLSKTALIVIWVIFLIGCGTILYGIWRGLSLLGF